ncbi:MAG: amidohydrolase family protein [Candidatus Nephthysia bennettiae]|uniref:Amidohydrolase family protein n=1 Tax=Candidatus Nephthysia bennettiae TaxID=3127016 RepID=A0A934JZ53_9BACT|nr:amidohydrolase family protein [Candidatus Dormibacteraeota bacterium]MBJ7614210.1 amidohydrolase family protein [Candidatus Dormibacteraeota bacterium]PZR98499.1 MAG: amidohydrolase family protein [Candidatus Dormibacteraeota bacterium]
MPDVLIRNGKLVDGTGRAPQETTSLFVCGDKIQGVGQEADIKARFREDIRVIDAAGHTVMPGLVDSHTHLTLGEPRSNDELFFHRDQNYSAILAGWNAQKVLRAGVTSVLDADGMFGIGVALREAVEAGIVEGPRMAVGGFALMTSVGGTAGKMIPESGSAGYAMVVRNRDEMVMETRRQIKGGVDWIKIHVTGVVPGRRGEMSVWTEEELRAVVDTAHDLGVPVIAHCRNARSSRDAARAGVDVLAHTSFMDEEALEAVVASGATLLPTFTFLANLIDYGHRAGASSAAVELFQSEIEQSAAMIRRAHDAGVKVLAGSESGFSLTPYGHWHAREMEVFVKHLEMTPLEAITAATGNGAIAVRRPEVGTLEKGKLADVLVVDGDPTEDVRLLQDRSRIHHVFKGGVEVDLTRPWPHRTIYPKERVSQYSQDLLLWEMAHELAGEAAPAPPPSGAAVSPVRDEVALAGATTSCPCSM